MFLEQFEVLDRIELKPDLAGLRQSLDFGVDPPIAVQEKRAATHKTTLLRIGVGPLPGAVSKRRQGKAAARNRRRNRSSPSGGARKWSRGRKSIASRYLFVAFGNGIHRSFSG